MSLTFLCLFINPWTMRHIFTNISDKLKNLSILYSTHTEYPYQMTKVLLIEQDINKVQGSYTQQRWSEQTILDMVFYDNGYNQTPCVKPSSDKVFSGLGHCCPCRCPNTWLLYKHNYYIFTVFFVIEKNVHFTDWPTFFKLQRDLTNHCGTSGVNMISKR